jgi:hypothetical protein
VESNIKKALEKENLKVMSSFKEGNILSFVFQQGYVIARLFPENNYCAFDIHLWSALQKDNSIKMALLGAVGSSIEHASQYRIVAGGMFVVPSWKEEEMKRGPRFTHKCDDETNPSARVSGATTETIVDTLVGSLKLVGEQVNALVVVLCGLEKDDCTSVDALSKLDNVKSVVTLNSCPELDGANMLTKDKIQTIHECELKLLEKLKASVTEDKVRVLVVDDSAPIFMGQMIHHILKRKKNKELILADNVFITVML